MRFKKCFYALYRGDDFIDLGSAEELAFKHNVSVRTIKFLASPVLHKRDKGNRIVAYRYYC